MQATENIPIIRRENMNLNQIQPNNNQIVNLLFDKLFYEFKISLLSQFIEDDLKFKLEVYETLSYLCLMKE